MKTKILWKLTNLNQNKKKRPTAPSTFLFIICYSPHPPTHQPNPPFEILYPRHWLSLSLKIREWEISTDLDPRTCLGACNSNVWKSSFLN